jgi:methionyl-tRNA synthetase
MSRNRPVFPARAVITNGMPYGDKPLHIGHIGGNFIHSDIYARFLRQRLGAENVIYISGMDCYGAGPVLKHEAAVKDGYTGTIHDFMSDIYAAQKTTLDDYFISLNMYAASGMGAAKDVHHAFSEELFNILYNGGYLKTDEVMQFCDETTGTILNGRQVEGRCPVAGCNAEKAYADECGLGHQYNPSDLIAPVAVTTGTAPKLVAVKNWYFDLERFSVELKKRQEFLREEGVSRKTLISEIDNFLKEPAIMVRLADESGFEVLHMACRDMPPHDMDQNRDNKTAVLIFSELKDREAACGILRAHKVRFRTGTTLVPFRLSGNIEWGIPVPAKEGISGQTFWVWPESLWAPISFVKAYLGENGDWLDWWFNADSKVYQFIGEDNIYFYAVAGMGLFMAMNAAAGRETAANLPTVIPNKHVYFGNKKASSSGAVKPPTAAELLNHYTPEQLRMHFAHMALHSNSAGFNPCLLNHPARSAGTPLAEGNVGHDPTLNEGNILTNVYNRIVRSCFYTLQKYFDGKLPGGDVGEETKRVADELIIEYEWAMYRFEFSKIIDLIDVYLRDANKAWSAATKSGVEPQTVVDTFHVVRVAATLLHPFAPKGTEVVREYLRVDEKLWDWEYIFQPLAFFADGNHSFKFLEPRVDFFAKHESQIQGK